jgi:hypothetical protein
LIVPAAPAVAQDSRAQPETIMFPFAPPTDVPIHYRVTKTASGPHAPPERVLEEDLTFRSSADGYLLEVRAVSVSVAGRKISPENAGLSPLPMPEIVSLWVPITLRLDSFGRAISISNWDQTREAIKLIPSRLAQSAPAAFRSRASEAATNAIQPILQLGDTAAWTFVAAEWPPVLTYGGSPFRIDEPMTVTSIYMAFDGTVPVRLIHDVSVSRHPDGGLVLDETQQPDQADFHAAVAQFYEGLAKSMSAQALAAKRANDSALKSNLRRTSTTHIETDSNGVLQSGYWEVRYQQADGIVASSEKVAFEKRP